MIDLGFNFLSDARKDSLQIRENYVERNKRKKKEEEEKEKVEKEEKRKSTIYIKEIKETLEKNRKEVIRLRNLGRTSGSQWHNQVSELTVESGYNGIASLSDRIKREYDSLDALLQESKEN